MVVVHGAVPIVSGLGAGLWPLTSNDTAAPAHVLVCPVVGWSQRNKRRFMMNHDGWMGGWMGGAMWLWTVIGVLVVVLLVILISKVSKK